MELSKLDVTLRRGPDGLHLFERTTGLNILFDEISPPPTTWSSAPRNVAIALTNACDLSCSYCYAEKSIAALDINEVKGWLRELDSNGCLGIGFGGGEPTLYRGLPEICRYAAANTRMAVSLTTHGHRLTNELLDALSGSIHFLRVSVDGVGNTYERLRGRSFGALRERLLTLRDFVSFGINYVVNADTFPDLDAAIELAEEAGATEFLLLPEVRPASLLGGTIPSLAALASWVDKHRRKIRVSISEYGARKLPTCNPLPGVTGLRAYAFVSASGILKRSSFDHKGIQITKDGILVALGQLNLMGEDRVL